MRSRLDVGGPELETLLRKVSELLLSYSDALPQSPVAPRITSAELRSRFDEPLPRRGAELDAVLASVHELLVSGTRHNGHPRFFGYVASPGNAVGAVADWIASATNINLTSWRSGPAATEIEHVAIGWIKQMIGYPAESFGLFVSGGSMAHLAAITVARDAKCGSDVTTAGASNAGTLRLYVSDQAHFSLRKAAAVTGIGSANTVEIPTDDQFRMRSDLLAAQIRRDRDAGYVPLCVVANAGTVGTGAVDPLSEVGAVAHENGLWFHVDGAYGGFAALAPSTRHLFAGIELADSVALDPHKWLYSSVGCGCILYRDPGAAYHSFRVSADYTKPIGLSDHEAFAFWDFGLELSRPFRALAIWMWVKYAGADALAEAIDSNNQVARFMGGLIEQAPDLELMAPVSLSIFCFRYAPSGYTGNLNDLNQSILVELQRSGVCYLSNTTIRGCFCLRGCVLNYRTLETDVAAVVDEVRRIGSRHVSSGKP